MPSVLINPISTVIAARMAKPPAKDAAAAAKKEPHKFTALKELKLAPDDKGKKGLQIEARFENR